jgi:hypothetical protein
LQGDQIGFAGNRQSGQRLAIADRARINIPQQAREVGRRGLGMLDLPRTTY